MAQGESRCLLGGTACFEGGFWLPTCQAAAASCGGLQVVPQLRRLARRPRAPPAPPLACRSDTEDEWQRVDKPAGELPGAYQSVTNVNPLSWEASWEDEIKI